MPLPSKPDAEAGADVQSKISIWATIVLSGALVLLLILVYLFKVRLGAWITPFVLIFVFSPFVGLLAGIATFIGPMPRRGWIRIRAALGIGLCSAFLAFFWGFMSGF